MEVAARPVEFWELRMSAWTQASHQSGDRKDATGEPCSRSTMLYCGGVKVPSRSGRRSMTPALK